MSTTLTFGKTLTLKQAAQLILATPENRYLLRGEPGIGKSALLPYLANPSFLGIPLPWKKQPRLGYIDVPNMDLGDISMPVIDRELRVTNYYPNARFHLHTGDPVIIMLDEYTKGADPVKNMLHPLLEVNSRLGDIPISKDSIIFLTGNLGSDGVGDTLKAHSRNRIIEIHVRKPTAEEWLEWAANNTIAPVVMAWVDRFRQCLASYLEDGEENNLYIYNPKRVQTAFVSPRSLERASNIVHRREFIDNDSLIASLSGAVGESASRDLQAFVEYQDQMPSMKTIIASPRTAPVPKDPGACSVLIFSAIAQLEKDTMPAFMKYLDRFESEWQATFAINIAKNPARQKIAFTCDAFTDWLRENNDLL